MDGEALLWMLIVRIHLSDNVNKRPLHILKFTNAYYL